MRVRMRGRMIHGRVSLGADHDMSGAGQPCCRPLHVLEQCEVSWKMRTARLAGLEGSLSTLDRYTVDVQELCRTA